MNKEKLNNFFEKIKAAAPALCLSAITAWFCSCIIFASTSNINFSTVPDFTRSVSLPFFIAVFFVLFAAVFLVQRFWTKKMLPLALVLSFLVFGAISVAKYIGDSNEKAYAALVFALLGLAVIAIAANFMRAENLEIPTKDISTALSFIIVSVAFVLFSALFIYFLGSRTAALCSPCCSPSLR